MSAITGRLTTCSGCGGPLFDIDGGEWLEPLSGLYIGHVGCLRCGRRFMYQRAPEDWRRDEDTDE